MPEETAGETCRPCEAFWGIIGVTAALVLLYIGVDLLSGGALTSAIAGRRTEEVQDHDAD